MSILKNEITSPRQSKNGTRAFLCNRTGAIYTSHSNGYVRRQMHPSTRRSQGHSGQYQLNPTKVTKHTLLISNISHNYTTTKRIMIMEETDRLELIERRAKSYRKK